MLHAWGRSEMHKDFGWEASRIQITFANKHRQEDNIKLDLRETRYESVEQIHLAHDRNELWALVHMVMNIQVL